MIEAKTISLAIDEHPSSGVLNGLKNIDHKDLRIISGFRKTWWHFRIKLTLLGLLMSLYKNPLYWLGGLSYLIQLRRRFLGNHRIKKLVQVDGKYYMGLYTPGWNDTVYKNFIASELHNYKPIAKNKLRFNHVYLAITKKCPLQCDHCYTWEVLNQKDHLNLEHLSEIIAKLQAMGTAQIHLTGGEPLLKLETIYNLLMFSNKTSNFWINTSGYNLTDEAARDLKLAGLTGVFISLDHFNEDAHNDFRKFKNAYYWAVHGAQNARSNQLVVALSLCLRNDFITEDNLLKYLEFAKTLGAHFVQFLEPKEVGHYSGQNVSLTKENIAILEDFYIKMNFSDAYLDFPIINYHGYYQRRQGCFAGGKRSMYIDMDGNLNACPFCHTNSGNILSKTFESQLNTMTQQGCPSYN